MKLIIEFAGIKKNDQYIFLMFFSFSPWQCIWMRHIVIFMFHRRCCRQGCAGCLFNLLQVSSLPTSTFLSSSALTQPLSGSARTSTTLTYPRPFSPGVPCTGFFRFVRCGGAGFLFNYLEVISMSRITFFCKISHSSTHTIPDSGSD